MLNLLQQYQKSRKKLPGFFEDKNTYSTCNIVSNMGKNCSKCINLKPIPQNKNNSDLEFVR